MTQTFNARFHHLRPMAVVACATPGEVAAVLERARRDGVEVVARSGGHCFAGHSSTEGIVVDVSPMAAVELDGELVTAGAGTRLGPLYDALQAHGLAIPGGTCPTVGIAGLALGGGLGVLGRTYGVTSDRLVAAEIVLSDGQALRCDDTRHPDLFWALRGAGAGNFGVVTSFTFRTVPAPVGTNLHLSWPIEAAAQVIDAWQTWAPIAPDELHASLKLTAGDDPARPPSVDVYAFLQDDRGAAETLVSQTQPRPRRVQVVPSTWPETRVFWAQLPTVDGGEPGPEDEAQYFVSKSEYFRRRLPGGAIDALLDHFARDRRPGEARELDFMPWGGAFTRVPADATAFVHRDELFQLKHVASLDPVAPQAAKDAAHAFTTESWSVVHRWGSGRVFPNFPDPDLDPETAAEAYYGENHARLLEIKARYDPDRLFHAPQAL